MKFAVAFSGGRIKNCASVQRQRLQPCLQLDPGQRIHFDGNALANANEGELCFLDVLLVDRNDGHQRVTGCRNCPTPAGQIDNPAVDACTKCVALDLDIGRLELRPAARVCDSACTIGASSVPTRGCAVRISARRVATCARACLSWLRTCASHSWDSAKAPPRLVTADLPRREGHNCLSEGNI